ncbi:LysR family transcriptional regulator (plasmid) [Paracoccus kondratievae]|uniref:LysR substrate-binding domain-containing protein n=1 Tax=Paracoccus kondratievae TaxID=135740 RepID=UPI0012661583|nr:LysR substrate-binding domain-containing protein [Paracoccus kondratievae]QFQ89877.1 LysR family transcriptional regulator [Paracoccus kondratievae]
MAALPDLNDFRLFAYVVDEGGFAAAGRRLGLPRSNVSRRIAALEERLGVRLIQRSTRSFTVTEIGRAFHRQCEAMLAEAEAASELIQREHAEPQGVVRVACPSSLIQFQIGAMLTRFLLTCPRVELHLESTNRQVDVLREGFDLALRVRFPPLDDSDLVVRRFGSDRQHLVAAPGLLAADRARNGQLASPHQAVRLPSLAWNPDRNQHFWDLKHDDGQRVQVPHVPRLATQDMTALSEAVLAGVGIAQLPHMVAGRWLDSGALVEVLPGWRPRSGIIHAVFPTRRGLVPSVRKLIDHLAAEYAALERIITPSTAPGPV